MKIVKKFQQGGEMGGQPSPEQMAAEEQAMQGGAPAGRRLPAGLPRRTVPGFPRYARRLRSAA